MIGKQLRNGREHRFHLLEIDIHTAIIQVCAQQLVKTINDERDTPLTDIVEDNVVFQKDVELLLHLREQQVAEITGCTVAGKFHKEGTHVGNLGAILMDKLVSRRCLAIACGCLDNDKHRTVALHIAENGIDQILGMGLADEIDFHRIGYGYEAVFAFVPAVNLHLLLGIARIVHLQLLGNGFNTEETLEEVFLDRVQAMVNIYSNSIALSRVLILLWNMTLRLFVEDEYIDGRVHDILQDEDEVILVQL